MFIGHLEYDRRKEMITQFFRWYERNYTQITWFLLGWLSLEALDDFGRGQWEAMSLDLALILLNYYLYSGRK